MMITRRLRIMDRTREHTSRVASLADFSWIEDGTFDANQIVDNPNLSLYCYDHEQQWAVFVMLPDGYDLAHTPFVYQAQHDHAEYLVAVPYPIFFELAETIAIDERLFVCIHNIGRCGSTLLNQALNEIDDVVALSEPDVFATFVNITQETRDEQIKWLRLSHKFMFRPAVIGKSHLHIVKLRNQCVDIMDVFVEAFPHARHLFMYRNAIDWLASIYRLFEKSGNAGKQFTRTEAILQQATYLNRDPDEVAPYFDTALPTYSIISVLAVSWLMLMARYIEVLEENSKLIAIRYEDLVSHQDEILSQLVDYLGLPQTAVESAKIAFERDSQAGTRLARDESQSGNTIQLPAHEVQSVAQILDKQAIINKSDVLLPGTLTVG